MAGLTLDPEIRRGFRRVLGEQKLDDLSQFQRVGFFDEVPLFSRYAQIAFLDDQDRDRANETLLELGLEYLDRIYCEFQAPEGSFFAGLTAYAPAEGDYLQPSIFVYHGLIGEHLLGRLNLSAPDSVFGAWVARHVGDRPYAVMQDTETVPGEVRVFIGLARPLPPRWIGLDELSALRRTSRV